MAYSFSSFAEKLITKLTLKDHTLHNCHFMPFNTVPLLFSTLPSPMLPGGVQADSMDSLWILHGFQVKCPKKENFTLESMESMQNKKAKTIIVLELQTGTCN